jgi:predicted dehydrogenase
MRKILIVGGGSIGERHLRCFQQVTENCAFGLCDVRAPIRADLAERYAPEYLFASLPEAAAQDWDAAVICTPAHLHIEHALALANCAQALLIEKPLSTSLEAVPQLQAAWGERPVHVGYIYRANFQVEQARRTLEAGTLGDLLQVTVVGGQHFPTFRPAYRETYYTQHQTGGGAIQDAATHMVNLLQFFAGPFDWIFCDAGHQALAGVEVEDTVHLTGRAGGGKTMLSLALNQFMAPNEMYIQLNGRAGSMRLEFHNQRYGIMQHDTVQHDTMQKGADGWQWSVPRTDERDAVFRQQARDFLAAIRGEAPVKCSLDEAIHTLKVNLAALKSAGRKRVEVV